MPPQTKQSIIDTLKPFLDAKEIASLPNTAVMVNPGVLPNPYLAAIVGAMKVISRRRAPVLILDSATAALPNDAIKKALWRIVSGKVVYAPIGNEVNSPLEASVLSDGGAGANPEVRNVWDQGCQLDSLFVLFASLFVRPSVCLFACMPVCLFVFLLFSGLCILVIVSVVIHSGITQLSTSNPSHIHIMPPFHPLRVSRHPPEQRR